MFFLFLALSPVSPSFATLSWTDTPASTLFMHSDTSDKKYTPDFLSPLHLRDSDALDFVSLSHSCVSRVSLSLSSRELDL